MDCSWTAEGNDLGRRARSVVRRAADPRPRPPDGLAAPRRQGQPGRPPAETCTPIAIFVSAARVARFWYLPCALRGVWGRCFRAGLGRVQRAGLGPLRTAAVVPDRPDLQRDRTRVSLQLQYGLYIYGIAAVSRDPPRAGRSGRRAAAPPRPAASPSPPPTQLQPAQPRLPRAWRLCPGSTRASARRTRRPVVARSQRCRPWSRRPVSGALSPAR